MENQNANKRGNNYRNEATMLADIRKAIEAIKRQTSTQTPEIFPMGSILTEFKLQPGLIVALVNLEMIKMESADNPRLRKYQWCYGVDPIPEQTVANLYDSYKLIESKRKSLTPKAMAKRTASAANAETAAANVKSTKANKSTTHAMVEDPFKNIKGTIFGLKQLKYMQFKLFDKKRPCTILVDKKFTLRGVELIIFEVNGSRLTLSFYQNGFQNGFELDKSSLVGSFDLENVALALFDGASDTTMSTMEIFTIPVKDPYNLKA